MVAVAGSWGRALSAGTRQPDCAQAPERSSPDIGSTPMAPTARAPPAAVPPYAFRYLPAHAIEDCLMTLMLRYGLLAAAVLCLPMFGPYAVFGLRPDWMDVGVVVGYTSMLLCLTATWFAMRREQQRRGPLGYGRLLAVGVGVAAVAGLTFGVATWLFFVVVGEAGPEALMTYYAQQIHDAGLGEAEAARRLAELEAMRPMLFNLPLQAAIMAATVFVIGVAESLVGAWLVHRSGRHPSSSSRVASA
jgi:hypothetical protein